MYRNLTFATLLLSASLAASASYSGRVFVDKNHNGRYDKGEKLLQGVKISDGLNVTSTAADGTFSLPGHGRQRFIFITTPSGYKTNNKHYRRITSATAGYDFGLTHYDAGIKNDGSHSFIQVTYAEIFNTTDNDKWIADVRGYAHYKKAAFIVNTGDLCYEKGMTDLIKLMNTENMGVPVYYTNGNHDLVKGKYGEEFYENIYGPVYYSFDVAGVHYVVLPMPGGDYRPGYTMDDVARWLKNDLATTKSGTPIYVLTHNVLTDKEEFVYKGKTESINLSDFNLKAWIYGHIHTNHIRKQGKTYTICTSCPDKGGIDHSIGTFRVMDIDKNGNFSSTLRYAYLHNALHIASPIGETSAKTVVVNTYSSTSDVKRVVYSCFAGKKAVVKNKPLSQQTDWTWAAPLALAKTHDGKKLRVQVTTFFGDGAKRTAEQEFVYNPNSEAVKTGSNWDNLLGNASHTGKADAGLDSTLSLSWVANVGANIYMTSPLVHDGKLFTASVDENAKGQGAVSALDAKTGRKLWRFHTEGSIKNTIAIAHGKVFAQDALGTLYAIDCNKGSLVWKVALNVNKIPGLIEGLATAGDTVFAGTGKGLAAYNVETGKLLWMNKGWGQGEATTTTLSVGDGVVVGSVQWTALYGNDAITGRKLWTVTSHGLRNRGASASIHDGLLYIVSDQSFFILDAKTGRIVVRKELPYSVDATSTPLLTDSEIIFGTAKDGLVALDAETLEEKWHVPTGTALIFSAPYTRLEAQTVETSPAWSGNYVFAAASDGCVYGINRSNGNVAWKYSIGAPSFSSVAISGNTLFATDFGGNVYAFSVKGGEK